MLLLNSARKSFENNFTQALESSLSNKFILSGMVGLGKTEVLRNLFHYTTEPVVICFPTHDLKEEFLRSKKDIQCIGTPRPPPALSSFIAAETISSEDSLGSISGKVKQAFPEFYRELESCLKFPETVVTTHDAFLCSEYKFHHKTIIFDEIPTHLLGNLQSESFLGLQELRFLNLANPSMVQKDLDFYLRSIQLEIENQNPFVVGGSLIKKISNSLPSELKQFLLKNFKDKQKISKSFKKITSLLSSSSKEFFVNYQENTLSTFSEFNFQKNKKFICFSATPSVELLSRYGFVHLPSGQLEEPLADIIHVPINTSRSSLSSAGNKKEINNLIRQLDIPKVISYKDLILRNQVADVYFGNLEGTNKYEKEDVIGIVGTPFYGTAYLYQTCILNKKINFTKDDFQMVDREIEINNNNYNDKKKIMFRTFQNDWLSYQHIFQIESSLIQAIGRLRPFTRKSKIYLFSKLPIMCNQEIS